VSGCIGITAAVALALLGPGLAAQVQPGAADRGAAQGSEKGTAPRQVNLELYLEQDSRAYFAACDANGDDKLDVIEASTALMFDPDQPLDHFQRLDRQMHGYLSFPEFDAEYREVVGRGGTFRLQPARAPVLRARPAAGVDLAPARRLVGLYDKDGDNMLDQAELQNLLEKRRVNEDPRRLFATLDADGSGRLVAAELVALAAMPDVLAAPADPTTRSRLTPKWQESDLDQDGAIAEGELERELRLIDPQLVRWTKKVMIDADGSKNGTLNAEEVATASARPKRVELPPNLTPAQIEQLKALRR